MQFSLPFNVPFQTRGQYFPYGPCSEEVGCCLFLLSAWYKKLSLVIEIQSDRWSLNFSCVHLPVSNRSVNATKDSGSHHVHMLCSKRSVTALG